jgi:Mn-dependent DtxR family transcriptional regulator
MEATPVIEFRAQQPRSDGPPIPAALLPTQQRRVLEVIQAYDHATEQPCPATVIARRLRVHHSTIQKHLIALHRKGWLRSPGAPAWLQRGA